MYLKYCFPFLWGSEPSTIYRYRSNALSDSPEYHIFCGYRRVRDSLCVLELGHENNYTIQ
jgi:hypothetical protein